MALKAILFDLDGVLADSKKSAATNIVMSLAQHGHKVGMEKALALMHGITTRGIIRALCPRIWEREMENVCKSVAQNDPTVWKMIKRTKMCALMPKLAKKYKLGIVTNRRTSGIGVARHLRVAKYFAVIATINVGKPKPSSEMLEYALLKMRVKGCEAIFFGDNEIDMQAGKNAKVKSFLVNEKTGAKELERMIGRQDALMQMG
ncbi:HAD family hydrolase [Candidatus Micrarchaeota archaeon]|nr:HAD family hydrolase [Candidatus Micrarchaeota archaeon]